jgi:hypothetical protein
MMMQITDSPILQAWDRKGPACFPIVSEIDDPEENGNDIVVERVVTETGEVGFVAYYYNAPEVRWLSDETGN